MKKARLLLPGAAPTPGAHGHCLHERRAEAGGGQPRTLVPGPLCFITKADSGVFAEPGVFQATCHCSLASRAHPLLPLPKSSPRNEKDRSIWLFLQVFSSCLPWDGRLEQFSLLGLFPGWGRGGFLLGVTQLCRMDLRGPPGLPWALWDQERLLIAECEQVVESSPGGATALPAFL